MALAGREVGERHLETAAHLRVHVMNLACESIGRKPLAHGVGVEESAIYSFWFRPEDAVKSDGMCCHGQWLD